MANELTLLGSIEQRIAYHMAGAARECIEVGRCLVEAKELVPAGGWSAWLAKQGIAERQAQRLMKLCREVPEGSFMNQLSISKIGEILALPDAEKREEIAKRAVEEDMTVKELRAQVAQLKVTADRERDAVAKKNDMLMTMDEDRRRVEAENRALKMKIDALMSAPPSEDVPEAVQREMDRLRSENAALQDDLDEQAELRQQAQQALLDLRAAGGEDRHGIDLMDGAEIMVGFLGKVGCYPAMTDAIADMSRSERAYLGNYVDMIAAWCQRFRTALERETVEAEML